MTMPARSTPSFAQQQTTLMDALHLLERSLGLSIDGLAQILGVTPSTITEWARRDAISPHAPSETDEKLMALLVLNVHLSDLFGTPEDARAWMHRPLPFLGHMTPIDAVKAGRIESVEAALEAIDEGFAS